MTKKRFLDRFISILICMTLVIQMAFTVYPEEAITEGFELGDVLDSEDNIEIIEDEESLSLDESIGGDDVGSDTQEGSSGEGSINVDNLIEAEPVSNFFVTNEEQTIDNDAYGLVQAEIITEQAYPDNYTGFIEISNLGDTITLLDDSIDTNNSKEIKLGLRTNENKYIYTPGNVKVYINEDIFGGYVYTVSEGSNLTKLEYSLGVDGVGSFVEFALQESGTYIMSGIEKVQEVEVSDTALSGEESETSRDSETGLKDEHATEPGEAVEPESEETTEAMSEVETEVESEISTEEETNITVEEETESVTEEVVETESEVGVLVENSGILSYKGSDYEVTLSYDEGAEIPEGSYLKVSEVVNNSLEYQDYLGVAQEVLGITYSSSKGQKARFFDISIYHKNEEGIEEEVKINNYVTVNIDYQDYELSDVDLSILHFNEDKTDATIIETINPVVKETVVEEDAVESVTKTTGVSFDTDSFSVYGIIEAPDVISEETGWVKVTTLEELENYSENGYLIGHVKGYYLTDGITQINQSRTGITKTAKGNADNALDRGAVLYHVLKDNDKYYFYFVDSNDNWVGVRRSGNSLSFVSPVDVSEASTDQEKAALLQAAGAVAFDVSHFGNSTDSWNIYTASNVCWNMQGGDNGKSFASYAGLNDVNAQLNILRFIPPEDDPLNLNGKTYGIAYVNKDYNASGMLSETVTGTPTRMAATPLNIRPNVIGPDGTLVLSSDTDLSEWTFVNITENKYYITTKINGVIKYLAITSSGISLRDDGNSIECEISITSQDGKYKFTSRNASLGYLTSGDAFTSGSSVNSTSWLSLVEKNDMLDDEDVVSYSAHVVSISDLVNVSDGKKVVLYATIWNSDTLKYEPYVVNYDGTLLKGYNVGNTISWYGNQAETAIWKFTEHHWDDGTPNYYYDLQNMYSGKYIAPQISSNQVLSNEPIGINMNGRRYGEKSSTIIAWDSGRYAYAALDLDEENKVLTTSPLTQAHEIFFAILDEPEEEALTTVETIDNNEYGITMKMVDFNNPIVNKRDSVQSNIFGYDSNASGLVLTELVDGYPVTDPTVTGKPQTSLETLFGSATPVNNLFLEGVYNEHGYFEFDSTQNFAHLEEDGNFTVYDQLAAIGDASGATRSHGQFMPYNTITPGLYTANNNMTDVYGQPLSDLNPRKGEKLHQIPLDDADYFFGMEMEASFVQTESGLDNYGHDIIFEFSGDDDFWLFVDGQLVLDLGGVHSASIGNINFRTGEVETVVKSGSNVIVADRTRNTTLYNIFRENYIKINPGATESEINDYLNSIFQLNNGNYVFKDFSQHTMKMFYMERGAGASNLKMHFNLSAIKPNTVILSKDISGTTKADYLQAEFPYQIYYRTARDGGELEYLLEDRDINGNYTTNYYERSTPVRYIESYTIPGSQQTYSNVFLLAPSEKIEIHFPEDVIDYRIVECGLNNEIYDTVKVNTEEIEGTVVSANRSDYGIEFSPVAERQRVAFDNHVKNSALRVMNFTKNLYDETGENLLSSDDDKTTFDFRLYWGIPYSNEWKAAYMQEYYIKDENYEYCKYDLNTDSFVSTGITEITEDIPAEILELITFVSSPNGAISKIPVGYTIEIRDVLVGTRFKFEERDNEIPIGYERLGYERAGESYIIEGGIINEGVVRDNADPVMNVNNKRGWGLSVNKEWSDSTFVKWHDDINLAVFVGGTYLPGSLKTLSNGQTSAYWYFSGLESGYTFDDYEIKEVVVNGSSVEAIDEGQSTLIAATPKNEDSPKDFEYFVSYDKGDVVGENDNIRTDVISNIRNGVKFVKEDMHGVSIAGATFTLKDSSGNDVGAESYTSKSNGLITIAYLEDGDYTLQEVFPAKGFIGIQHPIGITVEEGIVSLSGDVEEDANMYSVDNSGTMPVVTIRNKYFILQIEKEGEAGNPLEGAHFAIYRQITRTNGTVRKDYYPIEGYEDLVTADDGIIISGIQNWDPGYYYVVETQAPEGYSLLREDVLFRIRPTGGAEVSENSERFVSVQETDDTITYVIHTVDGIKNKRVKIRKVDADNPNLPVEGAYFDLYRVVDSVREDTPLYSGMFSNSEGYLYFGNSTEFELNYGDYELVETTTPLGYQPRESNVTINVSDSGVSYEEGPLSESGEGLHYDIQNNVYTIDVSNAVSNALLKVTKEVTGIVDQTTDFTFTLMLEKNGLQVGNWGCQKKNASGVLSDSSILFTRVNNRLVGTFQLKAKEELLIEIPQGTRYTITESPDSMYWTTIGTSPEHRNSETGLMPNDEVTVDFVNHINITVPTNSTFPLKIGLVLAVVSIGMYLILWFKKKKYI